MLEKGALEEVDKLIRLPLDPSHPILKAVGVRELALFLKGEIELDLAKRGHNRPRGVMQNANQHGLGTNSESLNAYLRNIQKVYIEKSFHKFASRY